jgi:hypothetical protein
MALREPDLRTILAGESGRAISPSTEQFRPCSGLSWVSTPRPQGDPMSSTARSILVYSIYVFALGATLLLIPNVPLPIVGLPQAAEVWIRVAGMTVIFLSILYFTAARNDYREIFVASVPIRFAVVAFFAAFAAAGFTSWNILLLTPLDIVFALWTWSTLRRASATA